MKTKGTIHLTDEQTAVYAEHLISGTTNKLPQEIRAHVKNCTLCAQEILMVAHTVENPNNHTDKPIILSNTDRKKIKSTRWLSIAASVAIILCGSYFINHFLDPASPNTVAQKQATQAIEAPDHSPLMNTGIKEQESVITSNDTNTQMTKTPQLTKASPQTKLIPKKTQVAYAPNTELEKLYLRYQNGTLRGDEIKILSPAHINGKKGEIQLQWNNEAKQLLILEFLNNKGEILFETETHESDYTPIRLQKSGLYYWKLMNADFDLVFCGKITLR